jgi:hypothetical protein
VFKINFSLDNPPQITILSSELDATEIIAALNLLLERRRKDGSKKQVSVILDFSLVKSSSPDSLEKLKGALKDFCTHLKQQNIYVYLLNQRPEKNGIRLDLFQQVGCSIYRQK